VEEEQEGETNVNTSAEAILMQRVSARESGYNGVNSRSGAEHKEVNQKEDFVITLQYDDMRGGKMWKADH
jgi:hypothetical protein